MSARRKPAPVDETFLALSAPRLPLDRWAMEHRIVADGPRAGRWNPRHAVMALEPMRAFSDERVRTIVLVAPSQLLKSEFLINCALHTAYYGDPCLLYEPDKPLVEKFLLERVRPAAVALGRVDSIGLEGSLRKKQDSRTALALGGGGTITGLSPQMKTGLSAHTARVALIDELDKMARSDMPVIARERTTTYERDAKVVIASTPTVDALGTAWREWSEGSCGVWMGRCPHCAELASMDWARVSIQKDGEGFWRPETAALSCESCGTVWSEADRLAAVYAGCYVHEHPDHEQRTFRVPGLAHLWRTFRDIVDIGAKALRAGKVEQKWVPYIAWYNGMLALPWDDNFMGLSATTLESQRFAFGPRGTQDLGALDPGVVVITGGIDIGERHIKAEWIGWGIDDETDRVRSWALRYVALGDNPDDAIEDPALWEALEEEIGRSVWRRADGQRVQARRILLDCGNWNRMVRDWCSARYRAEAPRRIDYYDARVLPSRGHHAEHNYAYPIDLTIGIKRKRNGPPVQVPATVYLMTQRLKEEIHDWQLADMGLPPGAVRAHQYPDPPAAHGYDAAYFKEFAGERKVPKRTATGRPVTHWERRHGWSRHDAWDCRVYALGALYTLAYPGQLSGYLHARARKLARPKLMPVE